jgi:hypothetical protein
MIQILDRLGKVSHPISFNNGYLPNGCLWIFIVGPKTTPAFLSFASVAKHSPILTESSVLKVAPTQDKQGKHVAFEGS